MTKKGSIVPLLLILQLYLITEDASFVEASIRSQDGKHASENNKENPQDHSRNEKLSDKMKPKMEDNHHYYLPTESIFGNVLNPSSFGASATSPPHITINPASVHSAFEQSSDPLLEQDSYINDDYIIPYASHCVPETPSNDESGLLTPSKELMPEHVILSGHIEIASKTSTESGTSKVLSKESDSSVVLQGSYIYMPSVTDT